MCTICVKCDLNIESAVGVTSLDLVEDFLLYFDNLLSIFANPYSHTHLQTRERKH